MQEGCDDTHQEIATTGLQLILSTSSLFYDLLSSGYFHAITAYKERFVLTAGIPHNMQSYAHHCKETYRQDNAQCALLT
jgi:hypothetical protein